MFKYPIENPQMINIGGTVFAVDPKMIEKYPESSLESILSGRHKVEVKDGHPFIDRDPETFKRTMEFLETHSSGKYVKISEEMEKWLDELGVKDYKETNN